MRLPVIALLLSTLASAQNYPIQGVVIDSKTNQALSHVRVVLQLAQKDLASVWTAADGRFSFSMPAGKYSLTAEYKGGIRLFETGRAMDGYGVAVVVGPGQDTSNLKFPWVPAAAISGTVRDEEGDPLESIQIQVIRTDVAAGRRRNYSSAFVYTNDLGQYRLPGLPPGNYYLIATGQPWYSRNLDDKSPLKQSYAPAYYPNALHVRGASPLTLEPAAEAKADFTLSAVGSVTVTINCPEMKDQSGVIHLMADGPEGIQSFQVTSGMYGEIQSLEAPPGRYLLRVTRAGRNPARVEKTIEVGTSDMTLDLALTAPVELTGKLTFKGDGPRSANTRIMFVDEARQAFSATVAADGSFTARNLYPGKYRLSAWDNRPLPLEDIVAEGAPFKDGFLHIGADPVQLSLAAIRTQTSELKGFVKTGDTPTPGAAVILAPKEWTTDPAAFRSFQTDSDGSFYFNNLSVGEYILFAVNRFDLEYTNQEVARPYLAAGRPVKIGAGVSNSETISLTTVTK